MGIKFENLQWSLLDSVSHSSTDINRCTQKGLGCSMPRDINRGAMVEGGTVVTRNRVGTESSKTNNFDFQKTKKSLKTGPFEIENTTALLYFVKIGSGGGRWQEENQMLLKVIKEI